MPNEIGGRADKEGNKYEVMVVIYYLLKVFNEEEKNITWEPIGIEENGTDIIIENKEGNKKYIQCKNRNGSKEYWDIGTLNSNNILKNWESHLSRNEKNQVVLFSPLAFTNLEDLIKRSKTNNNLIDFYVFQVMKSGKSLRDLFTNICEQFKIDTSKFNLENQTDEMIEGLNKIVNYLKRIDIITWTEQALKEYILSRIEQFFIGNKEQNYFLLTGIVWSEDLFGKPINKIQLINLLKNNNIEFKNSALDDSTLEKIEKLNKFYDKVFSPINDNLFSRKEFNECEKFLEDENSIIIYGESGIGKSGVTKYITDYCKKNNIVYIAIKLDKNVPKDNLELWSKDLGFKKSIVSCLDELSRNNKGVIILDQLDALR